MLARSALALARRPRSLFPVKTLAVLSLSTSTASAAAGAAGGLHALAGKRIDAAPVTMADFLGKPVLVVNVASR